MDVGNEDEQNHVPSALTIANSIDINKRLHEVEFRLAFTVRINFAQLMSPQIKLNKLF